MELINISSHAVDFELDCTESDKGLAPKLMSTREVYGPEDYDPSCLGTLVCSRVR